MIYVKDYIHYKRRDDLEINGTECIWIEIVFFFSNKHISIGVYYRPPTIDNAHHAMILDSMELAIDTGIGNIFIMGDLNLNVAQSAIDICCQLSLH
jgi:hypothetical protein